MRRAGLSRAAKRWLYLLHRWLGIVTCLLFLIWFLSGLVMIYVPFPALSEQERLAGLAPIDWTRVQLAPAAAERIATPAAPPRSITLEMLGGEPVWRVDPAQGPQLTLTAATGAPMTAIDAGTAVRAANIFARAPVESVERIERDQWTVAGRYDVHRPLWRTRLAQPGGHDLYVSGTTGAVVLDTNTYERFWNWLGSVPHWIYLTGLRQHPEAWRQVVLWVSGPCIVGALTGMWIGILRVRIGRRRFPDGRITRYRGWMKWHHIAGLVGGIILTLWIFSGWLSVDPGRLFESPGIAPEARAAYAEAGRLPPLQMHELARLATGAKRVEFGWAAGQPLALIEQVDERAVLDARGLRPTHLDQRQLIAAAARLVPGSKVAAVERLTAPDLYWYEVAALPTLPVLRIKFADPAGTWVHIDPETGKLLGEIDRRGRIYRWAFDLFHKWDLNLLTLHRPAWDIFLWLFSLAGIVTSVTAIRIGWMRLQGQRRP